MKNKNLIVEETFTLPDFHDLSPTDNADQDGVYKEALDFAFTNPNILNIALSGPYGSGKSSIIRTYRKNSNLKFLNISLASFKEEKEETEQQLIEKSIIQQMLYGESIKTLSQSRFKRIRKPAYILLKAGSFVLWLMLLLWFRENQANILTWSYWSIDQGWLHLGGKSVALLLIIGMAVAIVAALYKASYGMTLKRVSLKNAEIDVGEKSDESILNRHLDEILYFFQQTKYDAVIFEDLDRFRNAEIFVKLREINAIVNSNVEVKRKVRFLYALKDDIFKNKNRAKFFDFIIPIIPIINNTNSFDKISESIQGTELENQIDKGFLREVSLFLDDLRLIFNALNELRIYYQNLRSEKLDVTKLFALIIYKNVYPADFERLHHRNGVFFDILNLRKSLVDERVSDILARKRELESFISLSENEERASTEELKRLYAGAIASLAPTNQNLVGAVIADEFYWMSQLAEPDAFDALLEAKNGFFTRYQNASTSYRLSDFDLDGVQNVVSQKSFQDRLENLLNKTAKRRAQLTAELNNLDAELRGINRQSFIELLTSKEAALAAVAKKYEVENPRLMLYLIVEGYLDDSYHLYTSNFHEGRMTLHDRDFVLAIRSNLPLESSYKLDTPDEVIDTLRDRDFDRLSILNISLLDHLLENSEKYKTKLKDVLQVISKYFEESENFLDLYLSEGRHVESLVQKLSLQWKEYGKAAVESKSPNKHIKAIFDHVPSDRIKLGLDIENAISGYISNHSSEVFSNGDLSQEQLKKIQDIGITFRSLESLSTLPRLESFVITENMFPLTRENLVFLAFKPSSEHEAGQKISAPDTFDSANYSTLLTEADEVVLKYIHSNIEAYVDSFILSGDDNTEENEKAIVKLVSNNDLGEGVRENIILKQNYIFKDISILPAEFRSFVMKEGKAEVSWNNIVALQQTLGVTTEKFLEFIYDEEVAKALSSQSLNDQVGDETVTNELKMLIIGNNDFPIDSYSKILEAFDGRIDTLHSDLDANHVDAIVFADLLELNAETFKAVETEGSIVSLIVNNFQTYISNSSAYNVEESVLLIVAQEVSDEDAFDLVDQISDETVLSNRALLQKIANALPSKPISQLPKPIALETLKVIPQTTYRIEKLTEVIPTWTWQEVSAILQTLPYDYKLIAERGRSPKIVDTTVNRNLVEALKKRDFISSYSDSWNKIRVNTFKKQRW